MKTLTQVVQESANKVAAENGSVILYAASAFCGRIARAFIESGIQPQCICDGDTTKHGKRYYGFDVLSPDEALLKYPNAKIFITSLFHAPAIIGHLVYNLGIEPERILNYEEVAWKKKLRTA